MKVLDREAIAIKVFRVHVNHDMNVSIWFEKIKNFKNKQMKHHSTTSFCIFGSS